MGPMHSLPALSLPGKGEDRLFYGLRLRTETPLPSLPEWAGSGEPDLILRRGPVPHRLPSPVWSSHFVEIGADGAVLVRIPDVVGFLVKDGTQVVLDEDCDAETSVIETFLFSVVAGVVLHKRGVLPLHASCVMVDDVAIAIAGVSGRGKSTLAGIMSTRGHDVVSDDICPVAFHDGQAMIAPGPCRIRLWPDSAELLGLSHEALETGRPNHPKRVLAARGADRAPKPLGAVVRIAIDRRIERPILYRLSGAAAITPMEELVYRTRLGRRLDRRVGLFQDLVRLAALVPIYQLLRPERGFDPSRLADLVCSAANGAD